MWVRPGPGELLEEARGLLRREGVVVATGPVPREKASEMADEDLRVLLVKFDQANERRKPFQEAVAMLSDEEVAGVSVLNGPPTKLLCAAVGYPCLKAELACAMSVCPCAKGGYAHTHIRTYDHARKGSPLLPWYTPCQEPSTSSSRQSGGTRGSHLGSPLLWPRTRLVTPVCLRMSGTVLCPQRRWTRCSFWRNATCRGIIQG